MGRVLLAAPRGYCAGVERAIRTVEEALGHYGPPVYVRKQIVHNTFVVADLTRRGAVFVEELDEVPDGALVIFSAHGVSPAVKAVAAERGLQTVDATCPLVTKVHKEAVRFAEAGYEIVLIGHAEHEEVEGTLGEAPGRMHVVDPATPETLTIPADRPVGWLSQTTLSVDETMAAVGSLRARYPGLVDPPSDDICYASQNRQEAVVALAARCDLVLVVGSENSSNSQRLVEVALAAGARAGHLIDRVEEADESWLDGAGTVGVSSGASVPEHLVTELLDWLARHGFADVETVTHTRETLTFALPPELRTQIGGVL
ncbi:4-hydroxy-3-methylbut-2-enyl diphosphate reductase [Nonomuraea longicatena]|uniref:4-hydroxy-3-methylbut-2-enyl diphosphate reductase n=1 Tax=Nonomuraea longicatena TaxID=83682 RepID=A0ABP4B3K3_9ACTN